jgi:succinate dehydrogenase / fumarate reductase cytochrome b subunit
MATLMRFLKSTILSKVVMAATGLILVLFLLGHMSGNLQMYVGREKMNAYAHFLQGLGNLLWFIRLVLFVCFVLHVWTSINLKLHNMASRPVPYVRKNWVKATLTARTMMWTGSMIGFFLAYHIMHFTLGVTNPEKFHIVDPVTGFHDVYSIVILGYQNVLISATYIIAVVLLGFHLNHAIASLFQTLGVNHPRYNGIIHWGGAVLSIIIAAGFISVPVGVLTGVIALPAGVM